MKVVRQHLNIGHEVNHVGLLCRFPARHQPLTPQDGLGFR